MMPPVQFTVGNTITVSVAIYRQNWRQYLKLSLIAHLWLLVPVYGWARYFAIAAWISKLSFSEQAKNLDSIERKQYFKFDSLTRLTIIGISTIFIPLIVGNIIMIPLAIILPIIFKLLLQFPEAIKFIESDNGFLLLGYFALFVCYLIWTSIYARLFVTDLTYGNYLKNHRICPYPINRSYVITKNNVLKIYKIIWLTFLISLPVYLIMFICVFAITFFMYAIQSEKSYLLVFFFPTIVLLAHILLLPLWQSVKAVVFHQLTKAGNRKTVR